MATRASHVMSRQIVCVTPELPTRQALRLMRDEGIRHLPVVSDGILVGILSDRDLLEHSHTEQPVVNLMTRAPITCGPDATIGRLAELMVQHRIDSLPILESEALIGIVTSTDLLELLVTRRTSLSETLPMDFFARQFAAGTIEVND